MQRRLLSWIFTIRGFGKRLTPSHLSPELQKLWRLFQKTISFENKSIERLIFFGVNTSKMFVGDVLAHFILAMISMTINILVAFLFWRLKFPSIGHFLSFIIQYFIAIVIAMIIGGIFANKVCNEWLLWHLEYGEILGQGFFTNICIVLGNKHYSFVHLYY